MDVSHERIIEKSLLKEADALNRLAHNPPENLYHALNVISDCEGRIVFVGIGKSAIVARKITASFNSIGTSSVFIHAADALHGDIGSIKSEDLVIVLSRSGQTYEVTSFVKLIQLKGNKIISMVNNKNSEIALMSDVVIYIDQENEADELNLIPTISTLLQMAIGDALTVGLMKKNEVGSKEFKKYHPGGNIGLKLDVKVEDLNHLRAKPAVNVNATLKEIIIEISSGKMGASAVIDNNDKVVGIITDGDLRRMLSSSDKIKYNQTAESIMSKNPKTIHGNILAQDALEIMKVNKITQLIILQENQYGGIVHMHELLQMGLF